MKKDKPKYPDSAQVVEACEMLLVMLLEVDHTSRSIIMAEFPVGACLDVYKPIYERICELHVTCNGSLQEVLYFDTSKIVLQFYAQTVPKYKLPAPSNYRMLVDIVKRDWQRRICWTHSNTLNEASTNLYVSPDDAYQAFVKDYQQTLATSAQLISLDTIQGEHKSSFTVPYSIPSVEVCGESDVVVVAARPGVGKTTVLLSWIMHWASQDNTRVYLRSCEMSNEQIKMRLLRLSVFFPRADLSRILLLPPTLEATFQLLELDRLRYPHVKMYYALDYIQLERTTSRQASSFDALSYVSREIKQMSNKLRLHTVLLSQLKREGDAKKAPTMADLKGSGSIEEDASTILLLWDAHKSGLLELHSGESSAMKLVLINAKCRHQATDDDQVLYRVENYLTTDPAAAYEQLQFSSQLSSPATTSTDDLDPLPF
jgi:hypothetical protein